MSNVVLTQQYWSGTNMISTIYSDTRSLNGANGTWPDNDMLPLSADFFGASQAQEKQDRGQVRIDVYNTPR